MSNKNQWIDLITGGHDIENQDNAQMETEILAYLKDKYGENFEMVQLTREFNGNNGIYYRAVFRSDKRPEKGVLYCYAEGYGEGTKVELNGTPYLLKDDYANVILQEQYAAAMQAELGEDVLVKCRLKTPNHMITDTDFAAGLEVCLENADLTPHLYVFVLADLSVRNGELKTAVEEYMNKNNVYKQYLYIGYQSRIDLPKWETLYYEKESYFERYLVDESDAECVEFSSFSLDEGLVKTSVVKE